MCASFEEAGFGILRGILSSAECDALIQAMSGLMISRQSDAAARSAGLRNLLQESSLVREVAASVRLNTELQTRLGKAAFPVRALFFDKTEIANWGVAWHQDLMIAVAERIEMPCYGPWSIKAGIPHVQPPHKVLETMVAVRLHLDDCDQHNGALNLIPGSHRAGKLSEEDIEAWESTGRVAVCELSKGDALLMRPLLLHASRPAATPHHRRVIHIEYATEDLPAPLRWFERAG